MGRTACTEPQCLYNGAPLPLPIPLLPLWAVRPVHSLSACTRVHLYLYLLLDPIIIQTGLVHDDRSLFRNTQWSPEFRKSCCSGLRLVMMTCLASITMQRITNLIHNLFLVYFVHLYIFRAYLGPSSGGKTVCIKQLVFIILFR